MKLRRQQQIERELNGYRAWIDKAGKGWWAGGCGRHRMVMQRGGDGKGSLGIIQCNPKAAQVLAWWCWLHGGSWPQMLQQLSSQVESKDTANS